MPETGRSAFSHSTTAATGFPSNQFTTPTNVMREVARTLSNNTVFAHRDNCIRYLDDEFMKSGKDPVGSTIFARLPQAFEVNEGKTLVRQAITEPTVPIVINHQKNVGFAWDSWTKTFYVTDVQRREIDQALIAMTNDVDFTGLSEMSRRFNRSVGLPSTIPGAGTRDRDAIRTYLDAMRRLSEAGIYEPYHAILSPTMHVEAVQSNAALFNPARQISTYFRKGMFSGPALGIERWYSSQNVVQHTVGALGGTLLVAGANQSGSTIDVDGGSNSVSDYLNEGDVFTMAGVFELNPRNYQSFGELMQFTVRADADTNGSGEIDNLSIYPSITHTGAERNVSNRPADDAAITVFGGPTSGTLANDNFVGGQMARQGLIYHRDAVCLAMADLPVPRGVNQARRWRNAQLGLSFRMVEDYEIGEDNFSTRLDKAYGWSFIRNLGIRVQGK